MWKTILIYRPFFAENVFKKVYDIKLVLLIILQHIKNEQHKQFVRDKKNYESLDILIKNGSNCNTAKFLQRTLTTHLRKGKTIRYITKR